MAEKRLHVHVEHRNGKGGDWIVATGNRRTLRATAYQWNVLSHVAKGEDASTIGESLGVSKGNIRNVLGKMYDENFVSLFTKISKAQVLQRRAKRIGAISQEGNLHPRIEELL